MPTKYSIRKYTMYFATLILAASSISACSASDKATTIVKAPLEGDLAAYTTKSGTWRVRPSGPGFIWTLDENPGWSSAMACNDTEESKVVNVGNWTLLVPEHACKFAQDEIPVNMDSSLIALAVEAGRWVGYDPDIASDWPAEFGMAPSYTGSLENYADSKYDPAALNGVTSGDNIVGTLNAQGGEYPVSRGSVDEADAVLITKAMNGKSIARYTSAMYNIAFAHAGFPYRTPFVGTMLRDPQKPISGLQYEYKLNDLEISEEVYSVNPGSNWRYDAAHLSNTGWALWLATEDPRIGMVVQSAAQFALATRHENYRIAFMEDGKGNMSDYRCSPTQTRSIYNCLNAMWRSRDVALQTRSGDVMLWSVERATEMYNETQEQIQEIMDGTSNATVDDADLYALKNLSAPFNLSYCSVYRRSDSSEFTALAISNFEDASYGTVPMYLRAKNGEAFGQELLGKVADQMVARVLYLGGAAGVDGRRDIRGSFFPVGPCVKVGQWYQAGPLPFTDRKGWAQWVESLDIVTAEGYQSPTDSFNKSNIAKVVQLAGLLKSVKKLELEGKIAPVTDLDAALAAMDLANQKTDKREVRFGIWTKHVPAIH